VIVVPALGAALRIAAGPNTGVHSVDGSSTVLGERVTDNQLAQGFKVHPSFAQRGVEATPATAVYTLEAQVDRRGEDVGCEDGVGDFEQSVGTSIETLVERVAEGAQGFKSIARFHSGAFCPRGLLEATRCTCSLPV
jgi:hypothetical protein